MKLRGLIYPFVRRNKLGLLLTPGLLKISKETNMAMLTGILTLGMAAIT